ncbi:MAG: NAD(P)/FAD-dependent oxidoreductase [Beijerinckiaceae bacterium]|nr:NAD(P)/FAD-dependent oxidoreductase [Beijerinckiaceae bacterium]
MSRITRRAMVSGLAGAALLAKAGRAQAAARIVVIGGGYGGATCARALKRLGLDVTLVEPSATYVSCPFSNAVIAGLRGIEGQEFTYDALKREGVRIAPLSAVGVDGQARIATLSDGTKLSYDRLVMAPGIDLRFDALPGYDAEAASIMPHAWKAGSQTVLLRDQLRAMPDGGVFVMAAPANPYRCPPGPYERASLIAHYFKTEKPRSKIIILDAKDAFSKQRLFQAAWAQLYPGMIEWVPLSSGGKVTAVDPKAMTLTTDFQTFKASVANVIPPQRAGTIAQAAGVADRTGWCPINPSTFESTLVPNVHVIGDAAIMGAIPRSAFAANGQGKACASVIAGLLAHEDASAPRLINTCYSLVAPDYGISIAGVYRPGTPSFVEIEGSGGTSPLDAPAETRRTEAGYAEGWFRTITTDVFG